MLVSPFITKTALLSTCSFYSSYMIKVPLTGEHCLTKDRGKLDTYFSGNRSAGPLLRAPPYMFIRSPLYCQSAVYPAWWQQLIYGFQPWSLPSSACRSLILFYNSSYSTKKASGSLYFTIPFPQPLQM